MQTLTLFCESPPSVGGTHTIGTARALTEGEPSRALGGVLALRITRITVHKNGERHLDNKAEALTQRDARKWRGASGPTSSDSPSIRRLHHLEDRQRSACQVITHTTVRPADELVQ